MLRRPRKVACVERRVGDIGGTAACFYDIIDGLPTGGPGDDSGASRDARRRHGLHRRPGQATQAVEAAPVVALAQVGDAGLHVVGKGDVMEYAVQLVVEPEVVDKCRQRLLHRWRFRSVDKVPRQIEQDVSENVCRDLRIPEQKDGPVVMPVGAPADLKLGSRACKVGVVLS